MSSCIEARIRYFYRLKNDYRITFVQQNREQNCDSALRVISFLSCYRLGSPWVNGMQRSHFMPDVLAWRGERKTRGEEDGSCMRLAVTLTAGATFNIFHFATGAARGGHYSTPWAVERVFAYGCRWWRCRMGDTWQGDLHGNGVWSCRSWGSCEQLPELSVVLSRDWGCKNLI